MEDYQKRVVEEKEELASKIEKLRSFLGCTASAQIEPKGLDLLRRQLAIMDDYANVLTQRIDLF